MAVQDPQDCTYGSDLFVMIILVCILLSHVMAFWLCLSPFIVLSLPVSSIDSLIRLGFVMEDTVFSLCLAFLQLYIHESYST